MSLKLYMDEHVPAAITRGLRERGIDVRTVQDDGRRAKDDSVLLDRATELGRVMFSRDTDLVVEACRSQESGIEFFGLVYAHPLRVTIGQCIDQLQLMAIVLDSGEMMNRVEFLPLQ